MNLFFKISLIAIVFFSLTAKAQTADSLQKNDEQATFAVINLSTIYAVPAGNNFANTGFTTKPGVALDIRFKLYDLPILIGLEYNQFDVDVSNQEQLGNYTDSDLSYIGLNVAYRHPISDSFRTLLVVGVGSRTYHNDQPIESNFGFNDSATSMPIDLELDYQFSKTFGLFLSAGYQIDWMNITTAPEIRDDFDTAEYVNFQLGVRAVF